MHTWCMAHKVGNFQHKQLLEFSDTTSLASISFAPGPYVSYSGNKFCCWLEITMQLIDSHSHCWKLILLSHINYEYVTHLTIVYAFQLNEIKEEIIQILEYSNIVLNYSQLHTATHLLLIFHYTIFLFIMPIFSHCALLASFIFSNLWLVMMVRLMLLLPMPMLVSFFPTHIIHFLVFNWDTL